MAAFRPGLSPPAVRMPMRLIFFAIGQHYQTRFPVGQGFAGETCIPGIRQLNTDDTDKHRSRTLLYVWVGSIGVIGVRPFALLGLAGAALEDDLRAGVGFVAVKLLLEVFR